MSIENGNLEIHIDTVPFTARSQHAERKALLAVAATLGEDWEDIVIPGCVCVFLCVFFVAF